MIQTNTATQPPKPKKNGKYSLKGIFTVIGLTAFFIIAMLGVLIAQRQAANPSEPVAPNAPASRPAAAEPTAPPALASSTTSIPTGETCQATFTVAAEPTQPATTITQAVQPECTGIIYSSLETNATIQPADIFKDGEVAAVCQSRNAASFVISLDGQQINDPDTTNYGSFDAQSLAPGAHTVTCAVCTGVGASKTCQPVTAACTSNFTVPTPTQAVTPSPTPLGASAQCTTKEAFRAPFTGDPLNQSIVDLGEELEYRITVKADQQTSGEVKLVDILPQEVTFQQGSVAINGQAAISGDVNFDTASNTLTVNLRTLATNNQPMTRVVSFRAVVNDDAPVGRFDNTAYVTTGGAAQENCEVNTLIVPVSGIAQCVSKESYESPISTTPLSYEDSLSPGQHYFYRVLIEADETTRGNVYFTDKLPDYVEFVRSGNTTPEDLSFASNRNTVSYTFPGMTAGETQEVVFEVKVADDAKPLAGDEIRFTNTATVATDTPIGREANSCPDTLKIAASGIAVCENKTAYTSFSTDSNAEEITAQSSIYSNQEFFYRISVRANSASKGEVVIEDKLDNALTFSSDTANNTQGVTYDPATRLVRANLGLMQENETKTVEFKVQVNSTAAPGSVPNSATVITDSDETQASNCTHNLVIPPRGAAACTETESKVALTNFTANGGTVIPANSNVAPDQEFVYKISVTAAEQTAGAVTITDTLPAVLEYIADDAEVPGTIAAQELEGGRTKLTATLPQMNAAEVRTMEFKVKVKDNGTLGEFTNSALIETAGVESTDDIYCSTTHTIPAPICNESCTSDIQCQQANGSYFCDGDTNTCRLTSNPTSSSCQKLPEQGPICNGSCTSDTECKESMGDGYFCSSEYGNTCRLIENAGAENCQPAQPQPTPTPAVGCNEICVSNSDCSNIDHVCTTTVNGNRCRHPDYPNSTSCTQPTVYSGGGTTVVYTQQQEQPTMPEQLPQTGPEDWAEWLKAGVAILGLGGLLLLLL